MNHIHNLESIELLELILQHKAGSMLIAPRIFFGFTLQKFLYNKINN